MRPSSPHKEALRTGLSMGDFRGPIAHPGLALSVLLFQVQGAQGFHNRALGGSEAQSMKLIPPNPKPYLSLHVPTILGFLPYSEGYHLRLFGECKGLGVAGQP